MKRVGCFFIMFLAFSFFILSQSVDSQQSEEIKPGFDVISDAEAVGADTLKGLKAIEVRVNIREVFDLVLGAEESKRMTNELLDMVKAGLSKWGLVIVEQSKGPDDKDWVVFEININIMQKKEVMPGGVVYSEIYFYYLDASLLQLVRIIRNLAYKSQYPVPTWIQYAMGLANSMDELKTSIRKAVADLSSDFLTMFKYANKR